MGLIWGVFGERGGRVPILPEQFAHTSTWLESLTIMETLYYLTFDINGAEIVSTRSAPQWHLTGPSHHPVVATQPTSLATGGIPSFCAIAIVRDRCAESMPANLGVRGGHEFYVPEKHEIVRGTHLFDEEWLVVRDEEGTEQFRLNTAMIEWSAMKR